MEMFSKMSDGGAGKIILIFLQLVTVQQCLLRDKCLKAGGDIFHSYCQQQLF